MALVASGLVGLVALEHVAFAVLEIFFWDQPLGMRVFGLEPEFARASATLADNQGLYNGFLAAGLVWGLARGREGFGTKVFFLLCVVTAGVFGAATAAVSILWIQALPGALALAALGASREPHVPVHPEGPRVVREVEKRAG